MTVAKILKKPSLDRADLSALIGTLEPQERQALYNAAYAVKAKEVGRVAYYRGLLEFSNQCIKNCLYCGIRRDNTQVERFTTSREDILAMAKWAYDNRYGFSDSPIRRAAG